MPTYTQISYHIVFATKNRERALRAEHRDDLYRYIWGILKERNCHVYRIGGVEDHIHILTSLHPTVALADLVKSLKHGSSNWIKDRELFPDFTHWQEGYGAFTHSENDKAHLIEYIKNQAEHHRQENFLDEYRRMLLAAGVKFDEKYLI